MEDAPTFPAAGQRHTGEFTSEHPLLREWRWPYVTISGSEDGPRTTIIAGIHGCEYVSIRAAVRLARELAPTELRGQVLVVPIVNLPAYWERTPFVCPLDGKNPNRVFPGSPDGAFSDVMAHHIFTTCIAPAQALVDLHGGDLVEELLPFAIYAADAAPEVAARSRALADAFGLPYTIARREEPGTLAGMTYAAAARAGIPGLIAEAGGIGQLTASDVELLVAGTRRALQVAGNLAGPAEAPGTTELQRFTWLYSQRGGFWLAGVRAGDEVRAGQPLGQILSLLGDPLETIEAPHDGIVIFRTTSAAVKERGLLLAVGA